MPRGHRRAVRHGLATAAVIGVLASAAGSAPRTPTLGQVLERASAWVAAYGEALATVVADERYVQTVDDGQGRRESRRIDSEFALVRVVDREEWIAFRDVLAVDGVRVPDRGDRLERLFLDRPDGALARARAIADESARYNLGPVVRNFNVPTAALFFLHRANRDRFRFRKAREIRRGDEVLWDVDYDERARPTLIRTPDGRSVPTHGRFRIDPETGRVTHTTLRAREPEQELDVRCDVTFVENTELGLPVPATMTERYEGRNGRLTEGRATYADYRRFRVDVRIRDGS